MNAIVKTRYGEVRGCVIDGVNTFKGIPYAAPPFGANWLRPPQPVEPWNGVRDALAFGPKAPSLPFSPPENALVPELAVPGEDCLNLNIWSHDLASAKQPVMVWIAGGGFEYHGTGATPFYDGRRFARDGIVCVTINYRVGANGFLYLDDGNANFGLLDQVAALEWVQQNIAAFGGDPENVTVFGESAGGMSVGTLLSMPRAQGLFRRAIAQSGAAHHVSSAATAKRRPARTASASVMSASDATWARGMTSTWVGATGAMSRIASTRSSSWTFVDGISPATIRQNRHESVIGASVGCGFPGGRIVPHRGTRRSGRSPG